MNEFILTKVGDTDKNGPRYPSYHLNLEMHGAPWVQGNLSVVPKLYKIEKLAPFYYYRDFFEKKLIPQDNLVQSLMTIEAQMIKNLAEKQSRESSSKPLFMPIPKEKKNDEGEIFYSCTVCSMTVYTPEVKSFDQHFFSMPHINKFCSYPEYKQIVQLASQMEPTFSLSKSSFMFSRGSLISRGSVGTNNLSKGSNFQPKRPNKKSTKKISYQSSRSNTSKGSKSRSFSVARPSTNNHSRFSTGEYIMSSKKLETPEYGSSIFEPLKQKEECTLSSEIELQNCQKIDVVSINFARRKIDRNFTDDFIYQVETKQSELTYLYRALIAIFTPPKH